jgi:CheY-like chemotaxis protein
MASRLASAGSKPARASAHDVRSSGCRILVVDDDEDSRDALALHLTHEGHTVALAVDGVGALALFAEFRPDLICTDIAMPRLNGIELCERVKQDPANSSCICFAITAADRSEYRRLREAGFDCIFAKPLDVNELTQEIAVIVRCLDGT